MTETKMEVIKLMPKEYTQAEADAFKHGFFLGAKSERNELVQEAVEWLSDNLQTIVDVDSPSKHHVESIPVLGSITQTEFLSKFRKEIKYLLD